MTFLRTYANSNRDKFPRVYQELKNTISGEIYMDVKFWQLCHMLFCYLENL